MSKGLRQKWLWQAFICLALFVLAQADDAKIHIAVVACGHARSEEAIASIRSAILSTPFPEQLTFHIFHDKDDGNDVLFAQQLSAWQATTAHFQFYLYHSQLPEYYAHLFAPCASQRLFLHELLSVDRVLYVDSDTIFLEDVAHLWNEFEHFSVHTVAALAAEHEPSHRHAYYKDEANHPYYNQGSVHGLNSGVILLNLKILRANPWNDELDHFLVTYTLQYHDQDLLNLYFYHHPERLHLLSCRWNYRTDHCFFQAHCLDVGPAESGDKAMIGLLHGSRGVFHLSPENDWFVQTFVLAYDTFVTGDPMDCVHLSKSLETRAVAWIQSVHPESITNNCQAIALANIFVTIQANCRRNKAILNQLALSRLGHLRDFEL